MNIQLYHDPIGFLKSFRYYKTLSSYKKKLDHYGIRGVTLHLFTSFLTNRKQYVAHKDNFSDVAINKFGVPQGSNFGSLLFLIYMMIFPMR